MGVIDKDPRREAIRKFHEWSPLDQERRVDDPDQHTATDQPPL